MSSNHMIVYESGDNYIAIEKYDGGMSTIEDNLHIIYDSWDMFDHPGSWNEMLDALTSMILHCYNNGVDVTDAKFKQSIADTLETLGDYS